MNVESVEKIIEDYKADVYPITIIKFLLNKKKILSYFEKAKDLNFKTKGPKYKLDNSDCIICNEKKSEGLMCRQHTSINRVITANNALFDPEFELYFYKNEIFKQVGNKLVIVYCPHPKLIIGEITDFKVKKVNPITIDDEMIFDEVGKIKIPKNVIEVSFSKINKTLRCWFNNQFSIIITPEDDYFNWYLTSNH